MADKSCPRCGTPMAITGGCCSKIWKCPSRDCRWKEPYIKPREEG